MMTEPQYRTHFTVRFVWGARRWGEKNVLYPYEYSPEKRAGF